MKRLDLLAYLRKHGCAFIKEGARHSLFFNPALGRFSTIPRHNDIDSFLARKICKDLGIPKTDKR